MTRPVLGLLCVVLAGCAGPRYRRPEVAVPPAYRGEVSGGSGGAPEAPGGLGELRWQELIRDERLNELIQEALANNHDVRIAAARVLEAAAQARAARSQEFPAVEAQAGYNNLRTSRGGSAPLPEGYPAESGFTKIWSALSWELDLWGRVRNATAAARAQLLAGEEARHAVMAALGGQVAEAYFLLRDLDLEKEIVEESLESRRKSLELVRLRVENGYSSEIDLRQAEGLVKAAGLERTDLERQIEQTENRIRFLAGRPPGPVERGRSLLDQELTPGPRPGLPAALLERRPDIRQAEQELIASHAGTAVARAAYFPAISLTASTGFESAALRHTLETANGTWVLGPAAGLPLFNAGRIRAAVRGARARQEQALWNYRRAVLQAFREVADALAGYRNAVKLRKEQEELVESLRNAAELADLRYQGGVSSYLEYLDSERQFLDARLRLAQVRRDELTSVIALYLGLGGGWR